MKWYRSLYWRIAVGIVAFLAVMLVVQAMLFVWTVSRSGRSLPGQSPVRLGIAVAMDLASVLERDPQTDLVHYLHEQYAQYTHPFFVMMADGRLISSGDQTIPEPLVAMARARLQRPLRREGEGPFSPIGRRDRFQNPERMDRADRMPPPERELSGARFIRPVPIVVHGELAGVVVVPPQAPFGFLLGRFAPMLAFVAAGVLVLGTVLATVLIFGPARRRLRHLESAARSLGAGDLSARAPDRGGDEIAAVASAFNAMAADLSARAEALAASDRVRRQLLADVSHELTTPVTAMRGYLETMMMPEIALDEPTKARYLSIIADETGRLEHIIGDLLDLARLEGGGGAFTLSEVSVSQLFARVAARHERAAVAAGVTIDSAIAPGAETVVGDRDRLEQALQNLAANALRYAPRGSAIRLVSHRDGDAARDRAPGSGDLRATPRRAVVLSVEDAGPGIAPEHLPYVFDRFYKADASRRGTAGGSGLGLSIVKAIVQRHGGEIAVDSRPGRTVFEFTIPDSPS
ncbi:MAG TPA: HAMP domain-containing sensor histidine kinase [Vicinamibacterales bacterium]|jgi:signal transduction histidine kinase|nr:HAMP domain-containing sensor histidine kinase [Vicinamibacterales bacterium]